MSSVFQALIERAEQLKGYRRVFLGFSGGLDSTVLLHQLKSLGLNNLVAVHVNHQLMPEADGWEQHCASIAASWACDFESRKVQLGNTGGGVEEAARSARYKVFSECVTQQDVLLTAHHADDQAETLLFRLFRGSGLKGLAAVRAQTSLKMDKVSFEVLRPFLHCSREQILDYARAHHLSWIDDSSNNDQHFDRNYLRHSLLPLVQKKWPGVCSKLATSASLLAESDALLDDYLAGDFSQCEARKERLGESINLQVFQQFSWTKQKHLLRYWLAQNHYLLPEQKHMVEVQKMLRASADATPDVSWGRQEGGCSLKRFKQRLYLLPRVDLSQQGRSFEWHTSEPLALGNVSSLAGEVTESGIAPGQYRIKFREGGERCRPEFRDRSQTLKKLLQELGLEPWLRDCVPLIYKGAELVAVADLWVCHDYAVPEGIRPKWRLTAA
ncbi:tRNA(Ile)-lysidine synthase [Alteromonadaceae bacterium Bs31]|nr:tRNA(Ile)-lysidine synthase [Alteromonadaceae bacterium Bs31]